MSPNDCPCIDNDELVVDTNLYIDDLEIGVPLIFLNRAWIVAKVI